MSCGNNMKQLGLAFHNHASTFNNSVPSWCKQFAFNDPYAMSAGNTMPISPLWIPPLAPETHRLGPAVQLLPYLERNDIYSWFDVRQPQLSVRNLPGPQPGLDGPLGVGGLPVTVMNTNLIPTFICPSSPSPPCNYWINEIAQYAGGSPRPLNLPRSDYTGMRGLAISFLQCIPNFTIPSGTSQEASLITNNSMLGSPILPGNQAGNGTIAKVMNGMIKMSDVTDGLSNTILMIESAGKQNEYFRGRFTGRVGTMSSSLSGIGNASAFDWSTARHVRGLSGTNVNNPGQEGGCSFINVWNGNPYSFHSGGVQSVRGDGSVSFINANVAPVVLVLWSPATAAKSTQASNMYAEPVFLACSATHQAKTARFNLNQASSLKMHSPELTLIPMEFPTRGCGVVATWGSCSLTLTESRL